MKALNISGIDKAGLESISKLTNIEELQLSGCADLRDVGVLTNMPNLKSLSLKQQYVSDENIGSLALDCMKNLEKLNLDETSITDAAIDDIAKLEVKALSLNYTRISDASIDKLRTMTGLKNLDLRDTLISNEKIAELQQALPDCKILSGIDRSRKDHTPVGAAPA